MYKYKITSLVIVFLVLLSPQSAFCAETKNKTKKFEPIKLHSENPHYFLWREKPTILITSAEHYGAVLNRNFDCEKYLPVLKSHGFNLTRTFSGAYCEPDTAFKIKNNTLSPAANALICPWARSKESGYPNGGNKFDLTKWDKEYFKRLKKFIRTAAKNGVVVELVLFCPFYEDAMWNLSPMNIANNINGIGDMHRNEVYTLKHPKLLEVQKRMVRRIVKAIKDSDNLYYEICNEPYFGGVTLEWQKAIADTIVETEKQLSVKHLIAQNIANKSAKITDPNPDVSIFNFHYAKPPIAVSENYSLNKVIGDDETGFSGSEPKPYRIEAWDFIIAGGGVYNNLDYSFTVGAEDGTAPIDAPGGGGAEFRKQLEILKDFINTFDFIKMRPDPSVVKNLPANVTAQVLSEPSVAYAVYINGSGLKNLTIELPAGSYKSQWIDTKTAAILKTESLAHTAGQTELNIPEYTDDIALRIKRSD